MQRFRAPSLGEMQVNRPGRRQWHRLTHLLLISLLSLGLVVGWTSSVFGQANLPNPTMQDATRPPQGVERTGLVETAPVNFEGKALFRVTAPTILNRDNPGNRIPVEVRAAQIEANLQQVIALDQNRDDPDTKTYQTVFDPDSLQIVIAILGNQTELLAKDNHRSIPQDLLTVTELDAKQSGLKVPELAERWRKILQVELVNALKARLPENRTEQINRAVRAATYMGSAGLLLLIPQGVLRIRKRVLRSRRDREASQPETNPEPPNQRSLARHQGEFLTALRQQFSLERRLSLVKLLMWLLFWAQVAVWLVGIIYILHQFPNSRPVARWILRIPIMILAIWFVTGLVNRLGNVLIDRFAKVWQNGVFFTFEDAKRKSLRVSTIVVAMKGLKTFIVYTLGVMAALRALEFPIGSVLALGAVAAFAISLASQNLIKDLVNGCLILFEDQYAIGDIIAIGTTSGLVENMNLRITQLRNAEGRLITIPNSLISQVENLTRTWSRVDFSITIAYHTDIKRALSVLQEVGQHLYAEPAWQALILEPPEVLGIDNISYMGVLIRVWIKTQPLEQWKVAREFRYRIRTAFEEQDIDIGIPQQEVLAQQPGFSRPPGNAVYADGGARSPDGNSQSETPDSSLPIN